MFSLPSFKLLSDKKYTSPDSHGRELGTDHVSEGRAAYAQELSGVRSRKKRTGNARLRGREALCSRSKSPSLREQLARRCFILYESLLICGDLAGVDREPRRHAHVSIGAIA